MFLKLIVSFLGRFEKNRPHLAASVHLEPLLGREFRPRRNEESASGGAVPLREGRAVLD